MSYFGERQTKRLESKGIKTERGDCASCGHSWWDHSMKECGVRGCKCDSFKTEGRNADKGN